MLWHHNAKSQFTPKMKANAVPRLLSSLAWIDQYDECNGMTSFMEFMSGPRATNEAWLPDQPNEYWRGRRPTTILLVFHFIHNSQHFLPWQSFIVDSWDRPNHEYHETGHSVTPESIHTKDESKRGSAFISSLVWIDQCNECNRMTSFMEFMWGSKAIWDQIRWS